MAQRYIGIDLNEKYAMVSCYAEGMSEPNTFSMVTGSEVYQIPLCIAKRKGSGQWSCGAEAKRIAKEEGTSYVDSLLKKALSFESVELEGTVYDSSELLFLFLKKIIEFPMQTSMEHWPDKLVITAETMNMELRRLFGLFAEWMQLPTERLLLLDYRESFYYYALSQSKELTTHEIALYYYTSKKLWFWKLCRDKRTVPQVVTMEEAGYEALLKDRDEDFAEIAAKTLAGQIVSAVYLVGDGFDGDWMKRSLAVLCRGRRVFMGKNLFSKGACYGAAVKAGQAKWQYLYMGDNELQMNVSLKVEHHGQTEFVSLITAGENWYEAGSECEVILSGTPSVDFWFQPPMGREAVVRSLELSDFPPREDKTTRLRISVKPTAADKLMFSIRDLGFGEIARSSEKIWEYAITL